MLDAQSLPRLRAGGDVAIAVFVDAAALGRRRKEIGQFYAVGIKSEAHSACSMWDFK